MMGAILLLTTLGPQRGMANANQATLPGWVLWVSILVPALAAVGVAMTVSKTPIPDAPTGPSTDLPRADLIAGEVPAWTGRTARALPELLRQGTFRG